MGRARGKGRIRPRSQERAEQDLDAEIRLHLEMRAEKLASQGWDRRAAEREALRRFGDPRRFRRKCREIRIRYARRAWLHAGAESVLLEMGRAVRTLIRNRAFTAAALATLVLGIAANVAVLSLVYDVMFRQLPYRDPDRLVVIAKTAPVRYPTHTTVSYPDFVDWQSESSTLDAMAATWYASFTLTGFGTPERIFGSQASANLMEVLGVNPVLGRTILPEENAVGAPGVVVIGESLWNRKFNADSSVLGTVVALGGEPYTVVGVMPAGFRYPESSELWVPIQEDPELYRESHFLEVMGRLKPGVSIEQATTDMNSVAARLAERHPWTSADVAAYVVPLRDWIFGDERRSIVAACAVVTLVLLLASANVASLQLARDATRRGEVAIRLALGAPRSRVVRQLLAENLLLVGLGSGVGALLGAFGRDLLLAFGPIDLPPYFPASPSWVVVVLIAVVLVGATLLFGLLPATLGTKTGALVVLNSDSRKTLGPSGELHASSILVALEVAVAFTSLTGATLLAKSERHQRSIDPGFATENVATAFVTVPNAHFPSGRGIVRHFGQFLESIRSKPGVIEASIVSRLPTGEVDRVMPVFSEGAKSGPHGELPVFPVYVCESGYFSAMGIPILRGSDFASPSPYGRLGREVVVNEAFARRSWPSADPIGRRIGPSGPPISEQGWWEVVGMVANTVSGEIGAQARPAIYVPHMEFFADFDFFVVVRSNLDDQAAFDLLRESIWSVDSNVPISDFRSMEQRVREAAWESRFFAWVFGTFSLVALLLASTGVYSIMAYTSTLRSREIAVRVAVGAGRGDIVSLVWWRALVICGSGVILGLFLCFVGTRFLAGLLAGVSPADPLSFIGSAVVLLTIGMFAALAPVRRVARIAPIEVLGKD